MDGRPVTDLVEFLWARFDEDEQIAKAAAAGPWHMDESQRIYADDGAYVTAPWTEDERDDDLDHIVRHDPARVLREVEAKRLFLGRHKGVHRCDWGEQLGAEYLGWCTTLKCLALPYADHPDYPDYDEEWRP